MINIPSPRLRLGLAACATVFACCAGSRTALASHVQGRALTLSETSVDFDSVAPGATGSSTLQVGNSGKTALQLRSVTLSDTTNFAVVDGCATSLRAGQSCSLTLRFQPRTAGSFTATLTLRTGGSPSLFIVALKGVSSAVAVTQALYTFPESDNSVTPLYALVNGASRSIDMTMYELVDTTFSGDLVAACSRGVTVRVLLDQNNEKSYNTPAYNQLNAVPHCSAVWANTAFEATHQKSLIVDGIRAAIMTLNLTSRYYATSRDFALLTDDVKDINAVEATFQADFAAGTPPSGTAGASDFAYVPGPGTDLVWSPTTAQAALTGIITNAKSTLLIENEELGVSATYILSALEAACGRGVAVNFVIVDQTAYEPSLKALESAGCGVHVYPNTTTGFYVHAKAVVADFGLPTQAAFLGSINYSNPSITENRELGLYLADPTVIGALHSVMAADYAGGSPL